MANKYDLQRTMDLSDKNTSDEYYSWEYWLKTYQKIENWPSLKSIADFAKNNPQFKESRDFLNAYDKIISKIKSKTTDLKNNIEEENNTSYNFSTIDEVTWTIWDDWIKNLEKWSKLKVKIKDKNSHLRLRDSNERIIGKLSYWKEVTFTWNMKIINRHNFLEVNVWNKKGWVAADYIEIIENKKESITEFKDVVDFGEVEIVKPSFKKVNKTPDFIDVDTLLKEKEQKKAKINNNKSEIQDNWTKDNPRFYNWVEYDIDGCDREWDSDQVVIPTINKVEKIKNKITTNENQSWPKKVNKSDLFNASKKETNIIPQISKENKESIKTHTNNLKKKANSVKESIVNKTQEVVNEIKEIESINSISEYFNIDKNKLNTLNKQIEKNELNLDIVKYLWSYKKYITENLSSLDKNILNKIKKSIWLKVVKLSTIVNERIEWVDEQIEEWDYKAKDRKIEIQNQRWIINSELNDLFSEVNDEILPSAIILTKNINTSSISNVDEIKHMFNADLTDDGEFDKTWLSWELIDANTNSWSVIDASDEDHEKFLKDNNIQTIKWVSLLNEKDIEIEKDATKWFMIAVATQITIEVWPAVAASVLPWVWTTIWAAVWAVAWWVIDVQDMFSDTEVLLDMVQSAWLVDPSYRMDKTWVDNILAWLWVIPWMTIALKGKKVSKFLSKIPVKSLKEWTGKIMDIFKNKIFRKWSGTVSNTRNIDNTADATKIINDFEKINKLSNKEYREQLKIMSQEDFVEYLTKNYREYSKRTWNIKILDNWRTSSNGLYNILTMHPKYRWLSEKALKKIEKLNEIKIVDYVDQRLLHKADWEKNLIPNTKFEWSDAWHRWHIWKGTNHINITPKSYITLDNYMDLSPELLTKIVTKLWESDFDWQIKTIANLKNRFGSFDNIVLHWRSENEVEKATELIKKIIENEWKKIDLISYWKDNKLLNSSHSEILVKKVKESLINHNKDIRLITKLNKWETIEVFGQKVTKIESEWKKLYKIDWDDTEYDSVTNLVDKLYENKKIKNTDNINTNTTWTSNADNLSDSRNADNLKNTINKKLSSYENRQFKSLLFKEIDEIKNLTLKNPSWNDITVKLNDSWKYILNWKETKPLTKNELLTKIDESIKIEYINNKNAEWIQKIWEWIGEVKLLRNLWHPIDGRIQIKKWWKIFLDWIELNKNRSKQLLKIPSIREAILHKKLNNMTDSEFFKKISKIKWWEDILKLWKEAKKLAKERLIWIMKSWLLWWGVSVAYYKFENPGWEEIIKNICNMSCCMISSSCCYKSMNPSNMACKQNLRKMNMESSIKNNLICLGPKMEISMRMNSLICLISSIWLKFKKVELIFYFFCL